MDLYAVLLWSAVLLLVGAAVAYVLSVVLIRPEIDCFRCGRRLRGWVWEGRYGLARRMGAHWESSCPSTWRREG
jgi:hypothetical protein